MKVERLSDGFIKRSKLAANKEEMVSVGHDYTTRTKTEDRGSRKYIIWLLIVFLASSVREHYCDLKR